VQALGAKGEPLSWFSKPLVLSTGHEATHQTTGEANRESTGESIREANRDAVREAPREASIDPPVIVQPKSGARAVAFGSQASARAFLFTPPASFKLIELEFATDDGFSNIIYRTETGQSHFVMTEPLPSGSIYWHARTKADQGVSAWTPPQLLVIQNN
jgi:hypothetical protein